MDEISNGQPSESGGFWVSPPVPPAAPLPPVASAFGATEILADPGVGVRPPRRRTAITAGVAAASVLLVSGGAFAAYTTLSGGGAQPEDVLPANTVALLKVDLDPSASQKLALFQLLQKFPNASGLQDSDQTFGDWLSRRLSESAGSGAVNYAQDIKPWLGQRFAIADLPDAAGTSAEAILVLQETDEKAAAAGLDKIKKSGSATSFDYAFADGYVLVASSADGAQRAVAAAKSANLASNDTFSGDVAALGSDEIVTAWADAKLVGKQLKSLLSSAGAGLALGGGLSSDDATKLIDVNYQGRYVLGLHATSDSLELKTLVRGGKAQPAGAVVSSLGAVLPDAWAVIDVAGIDRAVDTAWSTLSSAPQVTSLVAEAKDRYGIELPGDLKAILGSELTVSASGGLRAPQVVGSVKTPDGAKAQAVLLKFLDAVGVDSSEVPQRLDGNDLYVASSTEALDNAGKGSISTNPLFQQAVADPAQAQGVFFVDLSKVWKGLADRGAASGGPLTEAQHVVAVGVSSSTRDGTVTSVIRVIFK